MLFDLLKEITFGMSHAIFIYLFLIFFYLLLEQCERKKKESERWLIISILIEASKKVMHHFNSQKVLKILHQVSSV